MITKAVLATIILASSTYGASELIDALKPATEAVVLETTIAAVLRDAQYLETMGMSRADAFARVVKETPNAKGISTDGISIRYQVLENCATGSFGDEYLYIIAPC